MEKRWPKICLSTSAYEIEKDLEIDTVVQWGESMTSSLSWSDIFLYWNPWDFLKICVI